MTWSAKWCLACVLTGLVLTGCGDDDGSAGTSGTGVSGTGAVGGDEDSGVAATGGTGGIGGTGGGNDLDAGAGTGGTGGTGGAGGTGGTGGTGGSTPCATDCNDSVDCTVDSCEDGTCVHVVDPSVCAANASCHPVRGCEQGDACGNPGDCADTDGCTTDETCNMTNARCEWQPLDGDQDGQAPESCGGGDCDDSMQAVHPGAIDTCNGVDDDCDSTVDENAECENGDSCVDGECICPEGKNQCGSQCVNRQTSKDHCGACNKSCGEAGVCVAGSCTCPSPGAICDTGLFTDNCVNTDTSHANCGGCGDGCGNLEICDDGACAPCGGMGEPCCGSSANGLSSDGCPGADLLCIGLRGQPLSRCACPNDHLLCNDVCVDPQTNNSNCGACGTDCSPGLAGIGTETCVSGACVECGQEAGQPCCEIGSLIGGPMLSCGGGGLLLLSCDTDTKLCRRGIL